MSQPVEKSVVVPINDGLANAMAGLGTDRDKAASAAYYNDAPIDHLELTAMYRVSGIARKIVDVPALDAFRNWRDWQAKPEQIEKIEAEEKRLNLKAILIEARKKARLFGESYVYFDLGDDPSTPINIAAVKQRGIRFLNVLDPAQIVCGEIELDPMSPLFGWPQKYTVMTGSKSADIHPSRLIIFVGALVMGQTGVMERKGESVLVSMMSTIKQSDTAAANVSSLIYEANIDVITMEGLMAYVGTVDGERRIHDRYRIAAQGKGNNGMLILDGKEKYERKSASFASLPDLIDRFDQRASAVADIPMTRLFGRSPGGMNSTGDSDAANYFDRIKAEQEVEIGPAMATFDSCLINSALGAPDTSVHYFWAPLKQMSEKEKADIFKTKSDAARTLAGTTTGTELIPINALSDALVNELIEDGTLSGLEAAMKLHGTLEDNEPTDAELAASAATQIARQPTPAPAKIAANDAAPRTLYVRRDVINRADFVRWANEQGFTDLVPDLHVTIAYSETPVDWFSVGESWSPKLEISAGGPRQMEEFGDDGKYKALLITASELVWRHKAIIEAGASWSWPEYQPHISIQIGGDVDLSKVQPYQGKIILGPEIFEELREG